MKKGPRGNNIFRIILALVFVVFGAIALGNNFHWWDIDDLFLMWWPLIIILVGLVTVFSPGGSWAGGIFLTFLGLLFLLQTHGICDIESLFWPAILIMIGVIIWPRKRRNPQENNGNPYNNNNSTPEHTIHTNSSDHVFNINAIFNSRKELLCDDKLSGGHGTAVFAKLELDLRQCNPSVSTYLEFTAIFANITLLVPSNWKIVKHGSPVLGKINDKRTYPNDSTQNKTVTVEMNAFFGRIDLMN